MGARRRASCLLQEPSPHREHTQRLEVAMATTASAGGVQAAPPMCGGGPKKGRRDSWEPLFTGGSPRIHQKQKDSGFTWFCKCQSFERRLTSGCALAGTSSGRAAQSRSLYSSGCVEVTGKQHGDGDGLGRRVDILEPLDHCSLGPVQDSASRMTLSCTHRPGPEACAPGSGRELDTIPSTCRQ